jgi:hypothetical protein
VLHPPDPLGAGGRVRIEARLVARPDQPVDGTSEDVDVGDGQVHALGARWRHDVGGVAGQHEPAVAHRRRHEAAHAGDRLLDHRSVEQPEPVGGGQADGQLRPDPVVGPFGDVLVRCHLEVQPRDLGRAHAVEREAPIVAAVDQLLGRGSGLGEDAEPGERVLAVVDAEVAGRDRRPAQAVEAVATGHHVAHEPDLLAAVAELHRRLIGEEISHPDIFHLEEDGPAGGQARPDEVLHHLLLAVHRDALAGELGEVDSVATAVDGDLHPAVHQRLTVEALGQAEAAEEVDRRLLEHAGPHPMLNVGAAAILDHDRLDATGRQQVGQHQAGRTRPHDSHLRPQLTAHVCHGTLTQR